MIQTINPQHAAASRTAEILSRYRPIAPKPAEPDNNSMGTNNNPTNLPQSMSKSPYLRSMWAHLQARPTRTRKRGRNAAFGPPPTTLKRIRSTANSTTSGISYSYPNYHHQHLSNNSYSTSSSPPAKNLAMHGFAHVPTNVGSISLVPVHCGLDAAVSTLTESISVVPFLGFAEKSQESNCYGSLGFDLNLAAADVQNPQELDFMPRLKEPVKPTVISPRPVRPVGSTIMVQNRIKDDPSREIRAFNKAEEVEKAVETEEMPVILSDSSNKVRFANAKYNEMIGQPECCWLDRCVGASLCKRIGGEVTLNFGDNKDDGNLMMMMKGFSCEVKIEWETEGKKKKCVECLCKAVKLECKGKDYQFLWRFYDINEEAVQ